MISARPPDSRSTVAYCSNTRTGSSELSTVTALVSRIFSVTAAIAASATAGADTAKSGRWCSPTPNTSSPSSSASRASSSRFFSRCAGETEPTSANVMRPSSTAASAAGGAEAVLAAVVGRGRQLVDHADVRRHAWDEQELGDAVAGPRLEPRLAEVHQHDADLAAVVRIDQPRGVDERDAVAAGESRARRDESGHAGRQRDRDAGRHRRVLARPQREPLGAAQVERRVARAGAYG